MQTVLTSDQLKDWAWSWAVRLVGDIGLTVEWLDAAATLSANTDTPASPLQTALVWVTCAYYEFQKGRWTRERAERQIIEAERLLCGYETPPLQVLQKIN